MKNTMKFLGIIALVAVIGFTFIGCPPDDNGGNDSNPQTATYTGTSGGATYTLKITENTARYAAQSGDAYELTVGAKKSVGKVDSAASGVLTLKPSNAAATFTAAVSGSSLTALNGTITWTDDTTAAAPGAMSGGNPGGDGGTFTLTGIPAEYNGKYAYFSGMASGSTGIIGAQNFDPSTSSFTQSPPPITITFCLISNGNVSLPMWKQVLSSDTPPTTFTLSLVRYTDNDTLTSLATIFIYDIQTVERNNLHITTPLTTLDVKPVTFTNGSATKSWSDGTYTANPNAP